MLNAVVAPAQTRPTATPSPDAKLDATREDRELTEARRRNEDAQATYYQKQTEKLDQTVPPKSFWRTLSDNAAILGALTAALVALFTLTVNQRTALRARRDTEFYEALKRFGDKDSPTVRASAAAILGEMSDTSFFAWRWRKQAPWWRPDQKMIRYPYFETVLDQLVAGLLIEEHTVVVNTIVGVLKRILPRNFKRTSDRLREANLRLQQELGPCLMEFFLAKGTDVDHADDKIWNEVASLTACRQEGLRMIFRAFGGTWFWRELSVPKETYKLVEETERPLHMRALQNRLVSIGRRLRQNVDLCVTLLGARPEEAIESLDFTAAYLAGVGLMRLSLRNIDFTLAVMSHADLGGANLAGACFSDAVLEGTNMRKTDLTNAKLHNAIVDEASNFDGSNWWQADFRGERKHYYYMKPTEDPLRTGFVYGHLLDKLFSHCGELSPDQLKKAHSSVKTYMEWRKPIPIGRGSQTRD